MEQSSNGTKEAAPQAAKVPAKNPKAEKGYSDEKFYIANGINDMIEPLANIDAFFRDMTEKAVANNIAGLRDRLNNRPLKIATMCSGTEAVLLGLEEVRKSKSSPAILYKKDLTVSDLASNHKIDLFFQHVFSAEIVAFKQAYIERNFGPPILFRDITEFKKSSQVA